MARLALLILLSAAAIAFADDPGMLSLDGKWEFRFAPEQDGPFDRVLEVPGCWDAQGVGAATDKMRHNAVGIGWYRRTFTVPQDWRGRRVWLNVGGVHRSAAVFVNGEHVADHVGYPVAFRADITDALRESGNGPQAIVIAVDSRQDARRDPLVGTFDVIDYMNLAWGGIYEHVTLESTGPAWIEDAFVRPDPASHAAMLNVHVARAAAAGDVLSYAVGNVRGEIPVGDGAVSITIRLPDAPFWTPADPNLLTLDLTLTRAGETIDGRRIRFGLRKLEIQGGHFVLNGDAFFIRGYGDDFNFPRELLPPADVEFWKKYLQKRKDFGFNAVRHHSMMPTESYLAAADEVGMFVQSELPIAYMEFQQRATPEGRKLYAKVWESYIRQMRNHPCVMAWCMGNEQNDGLPFGPELYKIAKSLDPDRAVIDSDGVPPWTDRPTLDYRAVQFEEHVIPWGATRDKYANAKAPSTKPVIVHEMSNLSCLPDPSEAAQFDGTIKPFWLDAMRSAVKHQRLEAQLPAMLAASWKLQASLLKLNIEAARLGASHGIGGYEQWLFRDYWTQSSGIESILGTTRALSAEATRHFNADAVLLWDRERVNFRAGEAIPLKIVLSDFRPRDAAQIREVRARLGDGPPGVLDPPPDDPSTRGNRGPWTGRLIATPLVRPTKAVVIAQAGDVQNEWPIWIWPDAPPPPPAPTELVTVAHRLTKSVLDRLEAGAAVLVTDDAVTFPTQKSSFKPAWWRGDEKGDFVHGNLFAATHPVLKYFPNDGYGDLQAYVLLNDRAVVKLDEVPGGVEPIVAALDVPWKLRRMAYLWEARVGRGKFLVSSFDLSESTRQSDPAAAWMYASLLRYASGDDFHPPAELPLAWLREHVAQPPPVDRAACVEGFAAVGDNHAAERSRWFTERDSDAEQYVVRQADGARRFTWKTAPLPNDFHGDTATFVWAGGIGYRSQPQAGPFVLSMDGRKLCDIPFTAASDTWASAEEGVILRYWVMRKTDEDSAGFFLLDVPRSKLSAGRVVELTLSAPGKGSRRWIAVAPYRDVLNDF